MRPICKVFAVSAIHFWKLVRIFYCVSILVATCVFSIVVVLQLLRITNQTRTYIFHSKFTTTRLHYDNSRQYVIQDSAFVGDEWPSLTTDGQHNETSNVVCLASQASVEKFHHVIDSGIRWRGPMSVAIFTPGVDNQVGVVYLQYLTRCFEDVMQNMTIHWVFPIEHPPEVTPIFSSSPIHTFDCSRRKEVLEQLLQKRPSTMMSWRQHLPYPQNLMRNVARKSCTSDYVILTDVDIVPNPGMCETVSDFVVTDPVRKCGFCVFVIPTYEIETNSTLPDSKRELLKMVANKTARSYRLIAYKPNQAATNVSAWEALSDIRNDFTTIGYQLPKFKFNYEPFYLSKDNVPPHDERFVGYGYTRNTQVYEMQMAGYKFFVLDNVFLIHPGMVRNPYSSSELRQKQVRENAKVFRKFMFELKVKYKHVQLNLRNGDKLHSKKITR